MVIGSTIGRIDEYQPELESFSSYGERLRLFMVANQIEEDRRVSVMLTVIGPRNYALLHNLLAPDKPTDKSMDDLLDVLKNHFEPAPVVIAERFCFYKRAQFEEESVVQYIAELRKLATHCEFGAQLEEALRDRFVCGLKPSMEGAQKKLLSTKDLKLKNAVEVAASFEAIEKKSKEMLGNQSARLQHLAAESELLVVRKEVPSTCYRCGKPGHQANSCHFKRLTCHKCGKVGHIAAVCKSTGSTRPRGQASRRSAHLVQLQDKVHQQDDSEEEAFGLFNLRTVESQSPPIEISLQINGRPVDMIVDTGAAVTVVSEDVFNSLSGVKLENAGITLTTYTAEKIELLGRCLVTVTYGNQTEHNLHLYVAKGNHSCLFGRSWLKVIRLDWRTICCVEVKRKEKLNRLLDTHKEVFNNEPGTIKKYQAKLKVQEGASPRFYRPRPIPFALKQGVELELDRLETLGILEKVTSSKWAAPIVVVPKKDGGLRICGDYKLTVNPSLDIDIHPLPKPEEIFTSLAGGQRFSKIDLSSAYQQLVLEDSSRDYVTINTPKGLYRYTRLPFGVASAPAIFQRTMDAILVGMEHVACYIDDIIVTGATEEEHLSNLAEVFRRLELHGIKAKKSKCQFLNESVQYLGYVIDNVGLHTMPIKVQAIVQAPLPKNVQELHSFLGLLNYYRKFIPNLSSMLAPLNNLLKKGCKWEWSSKCTKIVEEAKQKLIAAPVLMHYDPTLPLILATDASSYGVGAVLSHQGADGSEHPIAFASRSLTLTERKYAQLEKEALSIIFGIKKFHKYLYGRKFKLVTDHKPLTTIFGPKSGVPTLAAARLQRWALLLSAYSFNIEYRNTEAHGNADGLSRLPLSLKSSKVTLSDDITTNFNIMQMSSLPLTHNQLKRAIRADPALSKLLQLIRAGGDWEDCESIKPYWRRRNELTVEADCLLMGSRVVVPTSLQNQVLEELHVGHQGMARMKAIARSQVWWPGIDQHIEQLAKSCAECVKVKSAPSHAVLHPWVWPTRPWSRIHVDFMGPLMGKMYFVIVDGYSKWPEVWEMRTITTTKTISVMKHLFSLYGLPDQVVSDNGPQFVSKEFAEFLRLCGVKHFRSAPYHPATNGLVERFNKTLKQAIRTGVLAGKAVKEVIEEFLLIYRATPHAVTETAPSELFMGRKVRIRLDLLKPHLQSLVQNKQLLQKHYHDKHSRLVKFSEGQNVWARDYRVGKDRWMEGRVIEVLGTCMYLVELAGGILVRRHSDQLQARVIGHNIDNQRDQVSTAAGASSGMAEEWFSFGEESDSASDKSPVEAPSSDETDSGSNTTSPLVGRYPTRIRRPPNRPGFVTY